METLARLWSWVMGPEGAPGSLTALQMLARAVFVYGAGLVMFRLAGARILARYSALDVVTTVVVGSVLSRAVNGTAPMDTTLVASASVLAAHRGLAMLTCRSHRVGRVLKGDPWRLVEGGRIDGDAMRRHSVSPHELEEAARLAGKRPEEVFEVWLERNGSLSVLGPPGEERAARGAVDRAAG